MRLHSDTGMNAHTMICNDEHSSCNPGTNHCDVHGYDGSVPAPAGYRWHTIETATGDQYTALVMDAQVSA